MDMSMMAATKPANTEKKVLLQPETMIKPWNWKWNPLNEHSQTGQWWSLVRFAGLRLAAGPVRTLSVSISNWLCQNTPDISNLSLPTHLSEKPNQNHPCPKPTSIHFPSNFSAAIWSFPWKDLDFFRFSSSNHHGVPSATGNPRDSSPHEIVQKMET